MVINYRSLSMLFLGQRIRLILIVIVSASLASCVSNSSVKTNEGLSIKNKIESLQIVDCLLPGQVRMLGNRSYITPRRPAMLTAADCRLRGGEYVAYDRADYKTALNVWMPAADTGDAEAQANVGEIFERGLGGEPNYEVAALWYKKSAEQGNKRALFNLATLYEQGLGVDKDKLKAINYYRQAWDMPEESITYQSAITEQKNIQQKKLQAIVEKKDKQIRLLKSQINSLQRELKKTTSNQAVNDEIQALSELVAELNSENQITKDKLAVFKNEAYKRKLRTPTVIGKDTSPFLITAKDMVDKEINFGKYYALVIGVETYKNMSDLDTPVNDINEVASVLEQKYGFVVTKIVNSDNISIMEAINNINQQVSKNDNLLIFYAGHGYRIQSKSIESGYWLPTNADAPPRDTNWIPNEFITRHLARLDAKRILVVADSCYASLLSSSPEFLMLGSVQSSVEFLKYKANKRSRLLITSGGDKPVLDNNNDKNSIFARAFIDTLKNNTDILTGPALFKTVHDRVVAESRAANFEQEPEYKAIKGAGHEVGEFFFVPKRSS